MIDFQFVFLKIYRMSVSSDSDENNGPAALVKEIHNKNVFTIEEKMFVQYFRLSRALALELIQILEPHWLQKNTKPDVIPFHEKLLTTLSYFAYG